MRAVTVTIRFEVADDTTPEDIDNLVFAATVQIEDPDHIATSNVRTSTVVEPRF